MADIVFTGETPTAVIGQDEIPNNVDIRIYKGDYYEWYISLEDSVGSTVDISQDTPKAQLRETYESEAPIELDCDVDSDGDIRIYLSSAVSSTLNPNKDYIWDLQTTNYKGDTKTWVTGDVDVLNEVTR